MERLIICEICGNEMEAALVTCPFCGAQRASDPLFLRGPSHRTVNLEKGLPTVRQALERLRRELASARLQGYRVLTLIHGYGSSGRGGAIRTEVRRHLYYLRERGEINDVLAGEDFGRRSGHGRQLIRRFPFLASHHDADRGNRGITLVVL
ncbi:Smr/MutS family protein [Thermodesulfobacteriota bacterium B35]